MPQVYLPMVSETRVPGCQSSRVQFCKVLPEQRFQCSNGSRYQGSRIPRMQCSRVPMSRCCATVFPIPMPRGSSRYVHLHFCTPDTHRPDPQHNCQICCEAPCSVVSLCLRIAIVINVAIDSRRVVASLGRRLAPVSLRALH